jgi:hypothetical protein
MAKEQPINSKKPMGNLPGIEGVRPLCGSGEDGAAAIAVGGAGVQLESCAKQSASMGESSWPAFSAMRHALTNRSRGRLSKKNLSAYGACR